MIYSATSKGPFKVAGYHDKDSKRIIGIIYKPPTWAAGSVYYVRSTDDYDIVVPTTFKGLYFKATNPGLSGGTEPTWPTAIGATVTDGGITWEAVGYNLMPPTVSITTSTYTASDGVTLASPTSTGGATQVTITAVPAGVTSFSITNHTIKSTAEEDDVSLLFKVADR
jgi:hypothetical protein